MYVYECVITTDVTNMPNVNKVSGYSSDDHNTEQGHTG